MTRNSERVCAESTELRRRARRELLLLSETQGRRGDSGGEEMESLRLRCVMRSGGGDGGMYGVRGLRGSEGGGHEIQSGERGEDGMWSWVVGRILMTAGDGFLRRSSADGVGG